MIQFQNENDKNKNELYFHHSNILRNFLFKFFDNGDNFLSLKSSFNSSTGSSSILSNMWLSYLTSYEGFENKTLEVLLVYDLI